MTELDPFNLERFVAAQATTFESALKELNAGRKRSHWMWFIFPQLRDLGRSSIAKTYGIASVEEAHAYLNHPIIGDRLLRVTRAVLLHENSSPQAIFGSPDFMKFRSCMTLFAKVDPSGPFEEALKTFFAGEEDEATLRLLEENANR